MRSIIVHSQDEYYKEVHYLIIAGYVSRVDYESDPEHPYHYYVKYKRAAIGPSLLGFIFGVIPFFIYLIYIECCKPIDKVKIRLEGDEEESNNSSSLGTTTSSNEMSIDEILDKALSEAKEREEKEEK